MSYASSKLNTENQFDLLARHLNRTGKHLNESLDMKEVILPERRRANTCEGKIVLRGLPTVTLLEEMKRSISEITNNVVSLFIDRYDTELAFIKATVKEVMQNVLQDDFIDVWKQMNLYKCVSGSFELNKIIKHSVDANVTENWQSALSLRLEQKLIASNRTLHNLHRVHDAYNNAVPLVNNRVTAEGRYDFLYITSELFQQTSEINETYIHLRGHLEKYIQNIDALVRMYNANGHRRQTCNQCLNYSAGFLEESIEYERDLKLYEALVIRKPLKSIVRERKLFVDKEKLCHGVLVTSTLRAFGLLQTVNTAFDHYAEFNKTHITSTIAAYLDNVKSKRLGSKLDLAGELTSNRLTLLLERFIDTISGIEDSVSKTANNINVYLYLKCVFVSDALVNSLLRSFIDKMYDHYNKTTEPEKALLDKDFFYQESNPIMMKLLRGENAYGECLTFYNYDTPPKFPFPNLTRLIKALSLRNLTSFKKRLESYVRMTRLDGQFFR